MTVIEPGVQVQLENDKKEEMIHIKRIVIGSEEGREDTTEAGTGMVIETDGIEGFMIEADTMVEEVIEIVIVVGGLIEIGFEAITEVVQSDTNGDVMIHIEITFEIGEKMRIGEGLFQNSKLIEALKYL